MAKNVLGTDLISCSMDPVTGFFRNGKCDTCGEDVGQHTVCVEMTEEFLAFSKQAGNDLSIPMPQYNFSGLQPGDRWCLCRARWQEARDAGMAPKVHLEATHISVIEYVDVEELMEYSVGNDSLE